MKTSELIFCLVFLVHQLAPCFICSGENRRWGRSVSVTYDRTCPTDCSQGPRITGDNTIFNCTVGNLSEVKKFKANFATKMKNAKIQFDPPKLLSIGFYHKHYGNSQSEAALNITFQLPKGKPDGLGDMKYTNAIFLYFQSVDDDEFRDTFYYNHPRERIFRFWDYNPQSFYDADHPRNISYDCMVGLNDSKPRRAYMITLETAFGGKITYNCTVWVHQGIDSGYTIDWLPTIATSLNTLGKSVQVFFEEFPHDTIDSSKTIYYNVSLLGSDRRVLKYKKLKHGEHEPTFTDLKHGLYYIEVSKCEETYEYNANTFKNNMENRNCVSAESYVVDATGIPKEVRATPITYTEDHDTLYMALAVGLGCLIGVTLVASLILIFLKTRKKPPSRRTSFEGAKKPTGLILCRSTADQIVIKNFALYLQNVCDCIIHADVLEPNRDKLKEPENWCSEKLEKASFVIIVCSKEPVDEIVPDRPAQTESFFSLAILKALEKQKRFNNIRIIPVKFSLGPEETIPPQLGTNSSCLLLMQDMEKLYGKIHSVRSVSKQTFEKLDSKTYHISREGSDLKVALDNARTNIEPKVPLEFNSIKVKDYNYDTPIAHLSKIEDSGKSVKEKIEDINISVSSINTFASGCNEHGQDIDSDTPETEPLLDNRHVDIKSSTEQFRIEGHRLSLPRQRHFSESYSAHRRQDFTDGTFVPLQECTTEYENRSRPVIERQVSLNHPCAHHISSKGQPPSYYNQNTVADSEQIYQPNVPSEFYGGNQGNPYHIHPHDLNNSPLYICPRHGNKEHFHSPHLDKRYVHSIIETCGERMYDEYDPKADQSYPRDHYGVYENRSRQGPYIPTAFTYRPSLEFPAVDPYERRHISSDNDETQIDSGYKSDKSDVPHNFVSVKGTEFRHAQDKIRTSETSFINQTINDSDDDSDKRIENGVQREGEISSAGRYSYPLSLSVKRDFHSGMFIPPEDLESCLSEQDGSSSTDIMDQLAEINVKNKD